jgi:hypothetical protein
MHNNIQLYHDSVFDYQTGYAQVLWFAEQARLRGWYMTERQLVHEIMQRERAAQIREQSSLPIVDPNMRSAAWHRGQADALRMILHSQYEGV